MVDFFIITKQTSLHPFDFVRNLFHLLVCILLQIEMSSVICAISIGCFDDDDVEQLVKESLQMKNFQHRNVIGMLGVCLDAGPAPYLVLPYMKNGDLLSYLKSNREELVLSQDEPEENKACVSRIQLYYFL